MNLIQLAIVCFSYFLCTMALGPGAALATEDYAGRHVKISFAKDTSVNGSRVYLGDIADCKGEADLCREAAGIDVSASPAPGRILILTQTTISRILDKEWPGVMTTFEGLETARIVGAVAEVRADDVRQKLQAWVNDRLDHTSGVKLTVSKVIVPYGSGVRPSQTQVDFPDLESVPFSQTEWLARNMVGVRMTQFRFTNPKDSEDQQISHGQAFFMLEKMLPVAANFLPAGTIIEPKDFLIQWVQIRRGASDLVTSEDQIIGKKTRQVTSAGEAFSNRLLEVADIVKRNQAVTMILRNSGLEIATKATTMDSGAKGQVVEVVNIANKKRMRAKVIDEQTVEAVAF